MAAAASGPAIVVGVDGSPSSLSAVRLAVAQARQRRRPLRVVHAFVWPLLGVPVGPAPGAPPDAGLERAAEQVVDEAVTVATQTDPEVPVTGHLTAGATVPVLLDEAAGAELLVLGDRGLGGFTGLLVGSAAVQVVAHAPCPVLVARGAARSDGPVVVGVDGSAASRLAVDFALAEADRRGCEVVALHAWTHPVATSPGDMLSPVYDMAVVEEQARQVLVEALAGRAERYPDVAVRHEVVHRRPSAALVERSAEASLVVVGARGRGGFTGLLLGSVSQALLHHCACPVAVVRRPDGG